MDEPEHPERGTQGAAAIESADATAERVKRKRQRLSLVCNYCKRRKIKCDKARPSCSNCRRFGIECQYDSPHWVNSSVENETIVNTSIIANADLQHKTREDLYAIINLLKNKLGHDHDQVSASYSGSSHDTEGSLSASPSSQLNSISQAPAALVQLTGSSAQFTPEALLKNQTIDLYAHYNTLSMKSGSHEDHKPLCTMSTHKKDHYLSFFVCHMMLTLRLNADFITNMFREDWKTKHPDRSSKWLLLLDTNNEDKDLKDSIDRILKDRALAYNTVDDFPLNTLDNSLDYNIETLFAEVLKYIPNETVLDIYLNFFFQYVWSVRPYVDEDSFKKDVKRIFSFETPDAPKMGFKIRSDFAIVATLLIILRYVSIVVQLMDEDKITEIHSPIKKNPISVKAINLAKWCLSFYKISQKSTIHIVQALLYLRAYSKDAPEDGNGMTLGQSQNIFGIILQSALQMGLNRDPKNYTQTMNNVSEANLRRRLWHCIVEIDAYGCVMAGTLSTLPASNSCDVNFPLVVSMDPVEHAQRDIAIREAGLCELYLKISRLVNDIRNKTNLNDLIQVLNQSRNYVDTHFGINNMIDLSDLKEGSKIYSASIFKNVRSYSFNIIQTCLELQIYFALCVHYESNSHLNVTLYKTFFKQIVHSMRELYSLSSAYLSGHFKNNLTQVYNFELLPLVNAAIYRGLMASMSGLLRAYHAQELIATKIYNNKKHMSPESYEGIILPLIKQSEYFVLVIKDKLAPKYYTSLKSIALFKYSFSLLRTYRFKPMNKIITFLESNEKCQLSDRLSVSTAKRDEIKRKFQMDKSLISISNEWMKVSNVGSENQSKDQNGGNGASEDNPHIVNIHNSNMFLEFSQEELKEHVDVLTSLKWAKNKSWRPIDDVDLDGAINTNADLNPMNNPLNVTEFLNRPDEFFGNNNNGDGLKNNFNYFDHAVTDEDFFDDLLKVLDEPVAAEGNSTSLA